jgi:NAD(P)-dependent dehydrogenase (short-subunit alcohol dehydrogenase family)
MGYYADLEDRIVLVTGGANGIGAAIVRAFHAQAARVFFCDADARAGQAFARRLGDGACFTRADLRREADIVRWIGGVAARAKRIDALVNNAAIDPRVPLADLTAAALDRQLAINLRAYLLVAREAVKAMPDGGAIVNLASITFHNAPAHMSAYVATKGGVLGLTRSLARELGPRRIRVNAVSPGWVMTARQLRDYVTPAVKRLIRASQCVPDLIQPEEIAHVVLFLASDASRAITGQEILADRGWEHS